MGEGEGELDDWFLVCGVDGVVSDKEEGVAEENDG
jgi:hypothetical protein